MVTPRLGNSGNRTGCPVRVRRQAGSRMTAARRPVSDERHMQKPRVDVETTIPSFYHTTLEITPAVAEIVAG
jgi:hypothetical protein